MSILLFLRNTADIPLVFFSKLLNITVYTYIAFEQGKMTPPPEIIKMLSLIYELDESVFYEPDPIINETISTKIMRLNKMNYEDKFKLLSFRILGNDSKPTYKNIKKVKDQFIKSIK